MERRTVSVDTIIENKNLVKGFLCPIFYNENGTGAALTDEDFRKVKDGYACALCLAEYVMYLVKCPVCNHKRDLEKDLQDPDPLHGDHLRARQDTEGMDVGGGAKGFDEFMLEINANRDIDHVALSKLMPSKRGRK